MYHLFAGAGYYPQSGLGDYVLSDENPDVCVEEGQERIKYDSDLPFSGDDWYSVIYFDPDAVKLVEYDSGWKGA